VFARDKLDREFGMALAECAEPTPQGPAAESRTNRDVV
jgi:hypothetical protein